MLRHPTKYLTAYHHGEVSSEIRHQVDAHLESCAQCRGVLEDIAFAAKMTSSFAYERASGFGRAASRVTHRTPQLLRFALVVAGLVVFALALNVWMQNRSATWDLTIANKLSKLRVGQWLETGASQATLRVADIGQVRAEPNTKLRILESNSREHRLQLERGTINAVVAAPPRLFFVETPSATAIDLGCAYTLSVDPSGASQLNVTLGQVELESDGRSSTVRAGWVAKTRKGAGPGTPYVFDAPAEMIWALDVIDFDADPAAKAAALENILAASQPQDLISLWHLLPRVDARGRERVYGRMVALDPQLSEGVTVEGIRDLNPEMIMAWKSRLGLVW
jgi:predicted anti-sigma-YlaC factor YlaD